MKNIHLCLVIAMSALSGCGREQKQEVTKMVNDPHSYSHPGAARVTHLSWKATVDFDRKAISAVATWKFESAPGAQEIDFDTKGLTIKSVSTNAGQVAWRTGDSDPILGERLSIPIDTGMNTVAITYETSPDAEALQWLGPEQTGGKKHPFLFTQSQAILARSWIPCQDSPGIKFTYDAEVTVPRGLLALMSASNPQRANETGTYMFTMAQPVPSYLLALTVGDVAFRAISDRSGVYAEPTLLDAAAWEFADMEKMIAAAEELYGPYRWDRYDLIVLPPSFPFGGMENPRLTFATPTVIAGDRSLTSLVAHELAHSWSGNLVTNATWNDFWLNEGFTVYFETRIMEKLYGKDYAGMLASLNLQDLRAEIRSLHEQGRADDTRLLLDLKGRNPDDGVTDIAYNKGYFFLRSIEEQHGREKFDRFLNDYFSAYAFKSMDTESFTEYITAYYRKAFNIHLADSLFDNWIYARDLPATAPQPHSERFEKVDAVIANWKSGTPLEKGQATNWSTHEWLHFLKNIPQDLTKTQMEEIDKFGGFTESGNAEIITAWGVISIRNAYEKMFPKVEMFLVTTGRRKFLRPLYDEMVKTREGKEWARKVYERARPNYHFVATSTFDALLR